MSSAPPAQARSSAEARPGARSLGGYLLMPILLVSAVLALYLYVSNQELDSIEARTLTLSRILEAAREHVLLTAASTVITLAIAIPLGVILTRPFARRLRSYVIGVLTVLQAVPTIAVLVLLAVVTLVLGFWVAIIGLVVYAIVPVLLNTMVGIEQVDDNVLEAGRGMGMSKATVLRKIELPLSIPVMLAGIRTALVINVGTATLATYINAGGLGDIIAAGLATNRFTIQLVGAALTSVLALLIDYLAGVVEDVLRPRGL